jgi:hypothetical protein
MRASLGVPLLAFGIKELGIAGVYLLALLCYAILIVVPIALLVVLVKSALRWIERFTSRSRPTT